MAIISDVRNLFSGNGIFVKWFTESLSLKKYIQAQCFRKMGSLYDCSVCVFIFASMYIIISFQTELCSIDGLCMDEFIMKMRDNVINDVNVQLRSFEAYCTVSSVYRP